MKIYYSILELLQFLPEEYRDKAIELYTHPDNTFNRKSRINDKFEKISEGLMNAFIWESSCWLELYYKYQKNEIPDIPIFNKKHFIKLLDEL